MCDSFFHPFLSDFYKDQNEECPLTKFERLSSVVLDNFAVNVA